VSRMLYGVRQGDGDLCFEDAIWGATRGWEFTGEMYVTGSLRRALNGAGEPVAGQRNWNKNDALQYW
jgi:hypothetical protein